MASCKPDHTGMLDRTKAKPGDLEDLFVDVEKFNPNHDKNNGRFTTGHDNKVTDTLNPYSADVFKPQSGLPDISNIYLDTTSPGGIPIYNQLDVDKVTGMKYAVAVDWMRNKYPLNVTGIKFTKLDQDTLAQCRFGWEKDPNTGASRHEAIMQFDPSKAAAAKKMWEADKKDIAAGKVPWGACSYAKSEDEFLAANVVHEYAHGMSAAYTLKQPQDQWLDKNDPMMGTKEWGDTINAAAKEGWKSPSTYGKQNTAELFSECAVTVAVRKTTGNKKIDAYVGKVMQ